METTSNRAVFLDRDGTVIEDYGYVRHPDLVRVLPGAGEAIQRFTQAGYKVVVVSNQSGVARGFFDEEGLKKIHARMEELLSEQGATLSGAYYCPFLDGPDAVVETYRRDSDLRKPKPGMLLQAAEEMKIDLSQSWMIGDRSHDVEAGRRAGCRTILLQADGQSSPEDVRPTVRVRDLLEAARWVERAMERSGQQQQHQAEVQQVNQAVLDSLRRIHTRLERADRDTRQHDFSVLRLFGALLQMIAAVAAFWGVLALFDHTYDSATARFVLACFLQLASISAFAVDRFR